MIKCEKLYGDQSKLILKNKTPVSKKKEILEMYIIIYRDIAMCDPREVKGGNTTEIRNNLINMMESVHKSTPKNQKSRVNEMTYWYRNPSEHSWDSCGKTTIYQLKDGGWIIRDSDHNTEDTTFSDPRVAFETFAFGAMEKTDILA